MRTEDWSQILSASVAPVVIISACGLLCLAFYNRLAAVVSRIRAFHREWLAEQDRLAAQPPDAPGADRNRRMLAMLSEQAGRVTRRARLIRSALTCLLSTIACLTLCSFSAGASVLFPPFIWVAATTFAAGLALLLTGVGFAMLELRAALEPVELEREFLTLLSEPAARGAADREHPPRRSRDLEAFSHPGRAHLGHGKSPARAERHDF